MGKDNESVRTEKNTYLRSVGVLTALGLAGVTAFVVAEYNMPKGGPHAAAITRGMNHDGFKLESLDENILDHEDADIDLGGCLLPVTAIVIYDGDSSNGAKVLDVRDYTYTKDGKLVTVQSMAQLTSQDYLGSNPCTNTSIVIPKPQS